MSSRAFVQEEFRKYYESCSWHSGLSAIEKREFGFAMFEGWMLRHKGLGDEEMLVSFLRERVPRDAYFSSAYYEVPEAEMEKKGWLGADLIFDIDADHVPTSCDKFHDIWTCGKCGFAGKGAVPDRCPVCESEKFSDNTWPCEVCLASAKGETMKLLDILAADFGFSGKEIHVFFSGNRGYHVHVDSEAVRDLDAASRKEIADYVSGLGFDAVLHGLDEPQWKVSGTPKASPIEDRTGWSQRLMKGVRGLVADAPPEKLRDLGLSRSVVESIVNNRTALVNSLGGAAPWKGVKGMGKANWMKLSEHALISQSAKIDTVVTTDVHRLIRMPDTLHGKTGFRKVKFSVSDIDRFDPFEKGVVLRGGTAFVMVSNVPRFRLGETTFGPFSKQKVELPVAAAVMLVCRGRGEVIQ